MEAQIQSKRARSEKLAKRDRVKPWRTLAEEWADQLRKSAPSTEPIAWAAAEEVLARKLLKEISLDVALKAVRYFINDWCPRHGKAPSFRLFWTLRQQVVAELSGRVETKRERLDSDEPKPEAAKKFPKIGWA